MSAEVAPKKRGRPKKTTVVSEDSVIVLDAAEPTGKARGKTAKKSTASTTSAASEKKINDVEVTNEVKPSTVKKRALKTSVPPGSDVCFLKDAEVKIEKAETVREKREAPEATTKAAKSSTTAPPKVKSQAIVQKAPLRPEIQPESVSRILQRATAFVKNSDELHQSVLQHLQAREATKSSGQERADQPVNKAREVVVEQIMVEAGSTGHKKVTVTETTSTRQPEAGLSTTTTPAPEPASSISTTTTTGLRAPDSVNSTPPPSSPTSRPPPALKMAPKYTLPYSTTTALAARQQSLSQSQSHHQSPSHRSPLPTRPAPASRASAPPLKPTEMPLEQLKRDPKYRELSKRWTRSMVALPFVIVLPYFLWEKYDEQRSYLDVKEWMGREKERSVLQSAPAEEGGGS